MQEYFPGDTADNSGFSEASFEKNHHWIIPNYRRHTWLMPIFTDCNTVIYNILTICFVFVWVTAL